METHRTPRGALVVMLALVAYAAPSRAVDLTPRQRAEAADLAAMKALEAGRVEEAAKRFEEAHALDPQHKYVWNAARLWERAGDLRRAYRLHREATRFAADAGQLAKDLEAIGAMEAKLLRAGFVRLLVTVWPASAEVRMDGDTVVQVSGVRVDCVRTGAHRLQVSAPQHKTVDEQIDVPSVVEMRIERALTRIALAKPAGDVGLRDRPVRAAPSRLPGWATVAGGGAALATGVVLWFVASSRLSDLDARADRTLAGPGGVTLRPGLTQQDARDGLDSVSTLRGVAIATGALGLVAGGVGAWLLTRSPEPGRTTLVPSHAGTGLALRVGF